MKRKGGTILISGRIRNQGSQDRKLRYRLVVKNGKGKVKLNKTIVKKVAKGKAVKVKFQMPPSKAKLLTATLRVLNKKDKKTENNSMSFKLKRKN